MSDHLPSLFCRYFNDYVKRYGQLPADHYKVAHAIMDCRTEALGGHVWGCPVCDHEVTMYNSCRNRHCPRCQAYASAKWVQDRIDELLPVPYFHVVFTIPAELNPFALRNKEVFYALMFKAVKETLTVLGEDKKYLGGKGGFIAILHTWGQNLMDHPHIHCVVPGAALSDDHKRIFLSRRQFLYPVPVMRRIFRGKMMDFFKKAVDTHELTFEGSLATFNDKAKFDKLVGMLYRKEWVVYAKRPFAGPEAVIKYLGSYTHRIAISEKRITSVCETTGAVTFSYKDYAHGNCRKSMTLDAQEFMRRFLLHVVPTGFMRIRHYGFLCNRLQHELLPICRDLLGLKELPETIPEKPVHWYEIIQVLSGKDPRICPMCTKGIMALLLEIPRKKIPYTPAITGGL